MDLTTRPVALEAVAACDAAAPAAFATGPTLVAGDPTRADAEQSCAELKLDDDPRTVLYVVAGSQASRRAVANLRAICDEFLDDRYALEVSDVREFPALADQRRILVAPTLIKEWPPPAVRLIGDLSDREQVLAALGLEDR